MSKKLDHAAKMLGEELAQRILAARLPAGQVLKALAGAAGGVGAACFEERHKTLFKAAATVLHAIGAGEGASITASDEPAAPPPRAVVVENLQSQIKGVSDRVARNMVEVCDRLSFLENKLHEPRS